MIHDLFVMMLTNATNEMPCLPGFHTVVMPVREVANPEEEAGSTVSRCIATTSHSCDKGLDDGFGLAGCRGLGDECPELCVSACFLLEQFGASPGSLVSVVRFQMSFWSCRQ